MKKEILVIGDSCTDKYVYGQCNRLCPEAPVPIIIPKYQQTFDGMAQNVYNNIKVLTSKCDIITNKNKPVKIRVVDDRTNQMIVRIDKKSKSVERIDVNNINFEKYEIVVVSDYNKGFLNKNDLEYIGKHSRTSFIDSKKRLEEWTKFFTFIKVNKQEYLQSKNIIDKLLYNHTIITLGCKGCIFRGVKYPSPKTLVTMDTSGAGDTFLATLSFKYMETKDIIQSIDFAQQCCIKVISQRGTATI